MGINVGNSILYMSDKLDLTMQMDRFTDKQLQNIVKYVKHGNVPYGASATSAVAEYIVNKFNVPHYRSNTWYLRWTNVDDQDFRDSVIANATLLKLTDKNYSDGLDRTIAQMEKKETDGEIQLWYFSADQRRALKKSRVKTELSNEVNDFLNQLTNREIKTIDITLWKNIHVKQTETN